MKIAWLSNPPYTYSGYGVQSKYFIKRLQRDGHQVVAVVNRQLDDGPAMRIDGIYCFPGGHGRWLNDDFHWGWRGLLKAVEMLKPEISFSLFDVWSFPANLGKLIEDMGSIWTPITPIDHDPIPPSVLARLKDLKYPVAMSEFGQKKMKEAGCQTPAYIPHGVDTNLYRPHPMNPNIKDMMGGRNKFVIGIVAANRSTYDRKAWSENLKACAIFRKRHPEDTSVYAHTIANGVDFGLDLNMMGSQFGLEFIVPDLWQMIEGFPDFRMVELYNCFDVLLLASRGEGFGIPLIEAQACGVPVITTNFSTGPELVGPGWLVEPQSKYYDEQYSYQVIPSVDDIVRSLEEAYQEWKGGKLSERKAEARKFAMKYDIERIYNIYMIPFLEEVMRYRALPKKKEKKKNGTKK
jgi:glycosyltransferase involved in cell wall biosynthesis